MIVNHAWFSIEAIVLIMSECSLGWQYFDSRFPLLGETASLAFLGILLLILASFLFFDIRLEVQPELNQQLPNLIVIFRSILLAAAISITLSGVLNLLITIVYWGSSDGEVKRLRADRSKLKQVGIKRHDVEMEIGPHIIISSPIREHRPRF